MLIKTYNNAEHLTVMDKKKILTLIIPLLFISTSAFAIKITLFIDIPTYIERSKDIVIAKTLETSENEKYMDGFCPINVEVLKVLKGSKVIGKLKITTIHPLQKDKKYLLSSIEGSAFETDFLAVPELSAVEIPKYFNIPQLEGITLEAQIKIIFQARYNQLKFEMRELEREKESLEKALNKKNP